MEIFALLIFASLLMLAVFLRKLYQKKKASRVQKLTLAAESQKRSQQLRQLQQPQQLQQQLPSKITEIAVLKHGQDDVASIRLLTNLGDKEKSELINARKKMPLEQWGSRFSPMLQALPFLVVAQQVAGRHLMEVSISGNLVRAADGNGFRPFTMEDGRIVGQARLHDISELKLAAMGAAVWSLVSIVVAQKHLSDIKETLRSLDGKVESVLRFLAQERRGKVKAGLRYVRNEVRAAEGGDFSSFHRQELESLLRELIEIYIHLCDELKSRLGDGLSSGVVGCGVEFKSLNDKIDDFIERFGDIDLCLNARMAVIYAMSIFTGGGVALSCHLDDMVCDFDCVSDLFVRVIGELREDVNGIRSKFGVFYDLKEKRIDVRRRLNGFESEFEKCKKDWVERMQGVRGVLAEFRQPRRFVLEVDGENVKGVWEVPLAQPEMQC